MFIVDSLLIGGLRFVLDKVAAAVDTEMNDDSALREQLILVNEAYEEGRMPEAEFREREAELLARLREIREHKKAAAEAQMSALPDEGPREVVIELPDEIDDLRQAVLVDGNLGIGQ